MSMKLPPKSHIALLNLVTEFNKAPKNDHVQRLFYLQKINYELNSTRPDEDLYKWINSDDKKGFHALLATYSINPNASFFLKGIQFAQAVALKLGHEKPEETDKQDIRDREYALMQQRDNMLQHDVFADVHEAYKALSLELYNLAYTNARMKELVEKQIRILRDVQPKIEAIKGSKKPEEIEKLGISYKTSPLGAQGNNQNYTFKMGGWDELMIWRVEDRSELRLEQRLHSHPVSKYFINDFALFTKKLQNKFEPVEYRPVVLSQFANQGNLAEVARRLQNESVSNIAPKIGFYFDQLTHFVALLMDAKAYHPDIKLTNFLADRNRILISDRKTLIDTENPMADTVRSSPMYAPDEYLECLDFDNEPLDYNAKASTTTLNMPQFMSYQLGMILKEFLILTQMDELPPAEEFRNADKSAASYFITPPRQIINLSFLVQELTRTEASKRMTIKQFQSLLAFKNQDPDNFYKQVERVFPSSQLGIEDELNEIKALLDERKKENVFQSIARSFMDSVMPSYYGNDLLHRANKIFDKISSSDPKETRLTRMAEKLAVKCYKEYAHIYFAQCSQSVENALFNKDWEQAPWYRKAMHWLTFGLYSIDRNPSPDISAIKIEQKLNGEEFQTYFPLLEFLPSKALDNLGTLKAGHFKEFLFSHLNEIVPQDSDESEESEELSSSDSELHGIQNDESTLLIKGGLKSSDKSAKNTDELSSGSIVIKDNKSEDSLPSATVVIKKKEDKAASAKSSLSDGTVIIKKKAEDKTDSPKDSLPETTMFVKKKETKADVSKDSLPANTTVIKKDDKSKMSFSFLKLGFFKKSKDDELAPPATRHRLARYQRVDSVRTALLRGDGSNRTVESEARLRVEDINWDPVSSKNP